MFDKELVSQAACVLDVCRRHGLMIATAESCTGGLIGAVLTAVGGSSDVVDRGFITYSNEAKCDLLGVDRHAILEHGAVSETVARQMAAGCLQRSKANIAIAVTGIAGPGGGSIEKPVGLVHVAYAARDAGPFPDSLHQRQVFADLGRDEVRRRTVLAVFAEIRVRVGHD